MLTTTKNMLEQGICFSKCTFKAEFQSVPNELYEISLKATNDCLPYPIESFSWSSANGKESFEFPNDGEFFIQRSEAAAKAICSNTLTVSVHQCTTSTVIATAEIDLKPLLQGDLQIETCLTLEKVQDEAQPMDKASKQEYFPSIRVQINATKPLVPPEDLNEWNVLTLEVERAKNIPFPFAAEEKASSEVEVTNCTSFNVHLFDSITLSGGAFEFKNTTHTTDSDAVMHQEIPSTDVVWRNRSFSYYVGRKKMKELNKLISTGSGIWVYLYAKFGEAPLIGAPSLEGEGLLHMQDEDKASEALSRASNEEKPLNNILNSPTSSAVPSSSSAEIGSTERNRLPEDSFHRQNLKAPNLKQFISRAFVELSELKPAAMKGSQWFNLEKFPQVETSEYNEMALRNETIALKRFSCTTEQDPYKAAGAAIKLKISLLRASSIEVEKNTVGSIFTSPSSQHIIEGEQSLMEFKRVLSDIFDDLFMEYNKQPHQVSQGMAVDETKNFIDELKKSSLFEYTEAKIRESMIRLVVTKLKTGMQTSSGLRCITSDGFDDSLYSEFQTYISDICSEEVRKKLEEAKHALSCSLWKSDGSHTKGPESAADQCLRLSIEAEWEYNFTAAFKYYQMFVETKTSQELICDKLYQKLVKLAIKGRMPFNELKALILSYMKQVSATEQFQESMDWLYATLGVACVAGHQYDDAVAIFKELSYKHPGEAKYMRYLALVYFLCEYAYSYEKYVSLSLKEAHYFEDEDLNLLSEKKVMELREREINRDGVRDAISRSSSVTEQKQFVEPKETNNYEAVHLKLLEDLLDLGFYDLVVKLIDVEHSIGASIYSVKSSSRTVCLCIAKLHLKQWGEAKSLLIEYLETSKIGVTDNSIRCLSLLGRCYYQLGEPLKAIKTLQAYLEHSNDKPSDYVEVNLIIGECCLQACKYTEAKIHYGISLASQASASGWFGIGKVKYHEGNVKESHSALVCANVLYPYKEEIWCYLVLTLLKLDAFEEAVKASMAIFQSSWEDPNLLAMISKQFLNYGKEGATHAVLAAKRMLKNEDTLEAHLLLTRCYAVHSDEEDALAEAKTCLNKAIDQNDLHRIYEEVSNIFDKSECVLLNKRFREEVILSDWISSIKRNQ